MTLKQELKILNSDEDKDIRRYFDMETRAGVTKELDRKVKKHMIEESVKDYQVALNDVLANEPELKERYYTINFGK